MFAAIKKVVVRGWDPVKRALGGGRRSKLIFLPAVAIVALGVYAVGAAAGAFGGDKPPPRPNAVASTFRCPPGQKLLSLQAGEPDGYGPTADKPGTSPGRGLSGRFPSVTGLDSSIGGGIFGQTFTALPGGIAGGELMIAMKPMAQSADAAENDSIELSFTDSTGLHPEVWKRNLGDQGTVKGITPGAWRSNARPSGETLRLDLAALATAEGTRVSLVPTMNQLRFIDIIIRDDTSIDYITLRLCTGDASAVAPTVAQPTSTRPPAPPASPATTVPATTTVVATATSSAATPTPTRTVALTPATTQVAPTPPIPSTPVPPLGDLSLSFEKAISGGSITGNEGNYIFSLKLNNSGTASIAGFSVSDALPAPVGLISAGGEGWTCTPGGQASSPVNVLCVHPGVLPGGSSAVITLSTLITPIASWQNCATAVIPAGGQDIVLSHCVSIAPPAGGPPTATPTTPPASTPTGGTGSTPPSTGFLATPTSVPTPVR